MGKASREKRERKAVQRDARQALAARVESYRGSEPQLNLPKKGPGRGPEISDSLAVLLQPYITAGMTAVARQTLARIGVMAWNFSITHGGIPRQEIEKNVTPDSPELQQKVLGLMDEISRRKLQLFPSDRRRIIDAELREQNNGTFYLAVSLMEDGQDDGKDDGQLEDSDDAR